MPYDKYKPKPAKKGSMPARRSYFNTHRMSKPPPPRKKK